MTDKFQPQPEQSTSSEGAAGRSGSSSLSDFMFRLPEGSLPPPGYMLPPPAPRVGDKFQPLQARPFLTSALAPAHVVWPVLMMPPGKAFRMEQQKGISREGGDDDKTTVSAASGVHTGRQKIPTVRERAYIDGENVGTNAGGLSPAFDSDTQTAHMDQSDSVDSHDPGASPSPVVPPGGPLAATNASYAGGSLAPAKPSGRAAAGKPVRTREEMLKAEDKDELVGTTYLGKYELISVLGAGGMGVIYKARQVFLDRVLAIKMLKNKFASPKARMRFHQEAKAAAALNHPGIVAINDFGIDDEDRPYMVMEYVQGVTLADIVKMSPQSILPLREALPVFIEMLDPMAVAHSHGVVHRDIKPSNIMLALREDGTVQIKLLDFGIAKMRDLDDHTIQDLTKTGEALGTPLYMSPEQIKGTRVDSRADIYSFGCVMYMCLTGVPPFVGENKLHTMDKHVSEIPLSLKEASIGLDFPPQLEACVMRCLAKEPEQRYQSSEALRRDLVGIACQLGMVKMPPGMVNPTQSFLDDAASNPPLSDSLAQAVTEFTSLELSTLCLTDPASALERRPGGVSALTADAGATGLTGSATRSMSQRNTVADLNSTGHRQLPVPYGGASRPGAARNELELAEDDAQDISYVDLEPSLWQRGQVRLFAALALLMVLGGSVSWYCLLGPGGHQAEDGKVKTAVDAPAVSQPLPKAAEKPAEKDPLDEIKEESGDETLVKMIAAKPFMTRLEPRQLSVTGAAMPQVARLKFLEVFSLWNSNVTAKGLSYINKPKLAALGLYSCSVDDAIMAAVLQFKNLTQVGFRDCKGITDSGASRLAALKNLTTVDLAGTSVSNKTAAALAGMPRLLTVLLDDTDVTDAGLKQLCRNGSIIWLSLDKCKVSEAGLASLKNTPKLIKLSVSGCDVGDGVIDTLLTLNHLEVVNLSGTKITDKGFMRLSGRKQLKTINIAGCNVSAEAADKFKKENPGVNVELSPFRGFYRASGY